MGSDQMFNALVFMVYADAAGNNVTLSPRLSYNHVEPSYSADIDVALLPGTGVSDDRMLANAVCHNCRSWDGGSIDPDNTHAPFIFAGGPLQVFRSDSVTASVMIHAAYGSFYMNLTQAVGPALVPNMVTANSFTATLENYSTGTYFMGAIHGCIMFASMLVIMPAGMMLMRVAKKPVWHTVCQTVAAGVAFFGLFTGIYCSALYNRVTSPSWLCRKCAY
jgi:hypothetical protein